MRITDVRTQVLLNLGHEVESTTSAHDRIVVGTETNHGIVGIGETQEASR